MLQSIYEYATVNGLSLVPNRVKRKIAGHICLDSAGQYRYLRIHDKKERKPILCPDIGTLQFSGGNTTIICEKASTILYGAESSTGEIFGNQKKHEGWLKIMSEGAEHDDMLAIIHRFLKNMEDDPELTQKVYADCKSGNLKDTDYLSFVVEGYQEAEKETSWADWFDGWCAAHTKQEQEAMRISCISGEQVDAIANANFPQLRTPQTGTGSYITSFGASAFRTYGIEDNTGTPLSMSEAETINAGLFHLLTDDSHHNDVFDILFWYDDPNAPDFRNYLFAAISKEGIPDEWMVTDKQKRQGERAEKSYAGMLNCFTADKNDKPKENSVNRNNRFHVMRFAVTAKGRFYVAEERVASYEELASTIAQWMDDTALECTHWEKTEKNTYQNAGVVIRHVKSLYRILFALMEHKEAKQKTAQVKKEFGNNRYRLLEAMIFGTQIPLIFYHRAQELINKSRTTGEGNPLDMILSLQIIKAYLRRSDCMEGKEMQETLNTEATSPAYHLGRLLAVIEKVQKDSRDDVKELTVTLGNQYYGALKENPQRMERLKTKVRNAYFPKLKRKNQYGTYVYYDKLISELSEKSHGLGGRMTLEERGMYDLGYEQQKRELYRKKETPEANDEQDTLDNSDVPKEQ